MKKKAKLRYARPTPSISSVPIPPITVSAFSEPQKTKSVLDDRIDRINASTQRLNEISANFHELADRIFGMVGAEAKANENGPAPISAISRMAAAQSDLDKTIEIIANAYGRLQGL